jgi:hypothetical protein
MLTADEGRDQGKSRETPMRREMHPRFTRQWTLFCTCTELLRTLASNVEDLLRKRYAIPLRIFMHFTRN